MNSYIQNKIDTNGMRIVRIEYDYACNMNCQHCMVKQFRGKRDQRALTVADVASIAEQADALGFGQFVITGGEPLLFPEFDDLVKAIDPQRFYITTDTNGWLLNEAMAKHLKVIGVSKVQVSIDSLWHKTHDDFRGKPGAYARAVQAVLYAQKEGLNTIVQTVVDKNRIRSEELVKFIEHFNGLGVPVCIRYAAPIGEWRNRYDLMIDQSDLDYVQTLEKRFNVFSHLTPSEHWPGGCIAMKRMINIMKWGGVNPCPCMQEIMTIGNVFDEPLKGIVDKGMKLFDKHIPVCLVAMSKRIEDE